MTFTVDAMTADARELVAELLELRGQQIVIKPTVATGGQAGRGRDYDDATPLAAQTFALFNKGKLDGDDQGQADRGMVRRFQFEMIGAYDANVPLGGSWEDDTAAYEIESVDTTQPYQVKAIVVAFLKVAP
jgi:hypothetical protein